MPLREIQRHLRRSAEGVRHQARAHGLSLAVPRWRLEWCDECATWRTRINANGRCRVCQARANIAAEEARIRDALDALEPAKRAGFDRGESQRGTQKRIPAPPVRRAPKEPTPYLRSKAEQEYLAAMEEWQAARLKLVYDAQKQRLKDIKAAAGRG